MFSLLDIKVVGCGGGGSNAVNRMIAADLKGIKFLALNTDAQSLQMSEAQIKIQLGEKLTKGLGAGSDPTIGQRSAEESRDEIRAALERGRYGIYYRWNGRGNRYRCSPDSGGDSQRITGPYRWCSDQAFYVEGRRRREQADKGIEQLKNRVDTLITIPNDRLLQVVESDINARCI